MPEITLNTGTGDRVDVPWGNESPHQIFHYLRHPIRDGGGNPWIIWMHGGAGVGNDARLPFTAPAAGNQNGNAYFHYARNVLTEARDRHFDIFSVQCDQYSFVGSNQQSPLDTIGNNHSQTATLKWGCPPRSHPVVYPDSFTQIQRCIARIKARASEFGIHPDLGGVGGTSFGAHRAMISQIAPPFWDEDIRTRDVDSLPDNPPGRFPSRLGYNSRVNFVLCHAGQPDMRYNPGYVAASSTPNVDVCDGSVVGKGYYGVRNKTQWDAVPTQLREFTSLLWWIEQGLTQWLVPHYCVYPAIGGTPTYPLQLSTVHHEIQFTNMQNAFRAAGVGHMVTGEVPATFDDTDATGRDAIAGRFFTWADGILPKQSHQN